MPWSARIVRRLTLAAAAAAVACPPVASALASPAGPAVRPGSVRTPAVVPWNKAGPGWAVAQSSDSTAFGVLPAVKRATTLYLTSTVGVYLSYPFYTWPASYHGPAYSLVDWSGDRQRVLLAGPASPGHPTRLEQISLATRKVISTFTLPSGVSVIGYTRPTGLNLLAVRPHFQGEQVVRYDLTGKLQRILATGKGLTSAIDSPDGTTVVIGTGAGLEQVSNSSGSIKRFSAPVPVTRCFPVRWWTTGTVLAWCNARGVRYYARLWLFPVGGGKVTALTPQREGHGPDFGDVAAWRLSTGRLYLQAMGPADCSEFIGQQWRNATLHPISVPSTTNNVQIVTALGPRLLLQSLDGSCGSSSSLLWFKPSAQKFGEQYMLRPPVGWRGVEVVVPFGRPSTS